MIKSFLHGFCLAWLSVSALAAVYSILVAICDVFQRDPVLGCALTLVSGSVASLLYLTYPGGSK
jgi:hypothetical protein